MAIVVRRRRSVYRERNELVAEVDPGHALEPVAQRELEDAAVKLERLSDIAHLDRDVVDADQTRSLVGVSHGGIVAVSARFAAGREPTAPAQTAATVDEVALRLLLLALVLVLLGAACGTDSSDPASPTGAAESDTAERVAPDEAPSPAPADAEVPPASDPGEADEPNRPAPPTAPTAETFGPPPATPTGPLAPEIETSLDNLFGNLRSGIDQRELFTVAGVGRRKAGLARG